MKLQFLRLRFRFRNGAAPVYFPPGKAANVIRGALGEMLRQLNCSSHCNAKHCTIEPECLYRRIFAPVAAGGPAGFANPPRPFVLRAAHLDALSVAPDDNFAFDLHLFLTAPDVIRGLIVALGQLTQDGLGADRGRVSLEGVDALDLTGDAIAILFDRQGFTESNAPLLPIDVSPLESAPPEVEVRFLTPTELKGAADSARPEFHVLIARLRDRISSLRALYGDGPLDIDFRGLSDRARAVKLVAAAMQPVSMNRRSSRSGATHSIGGWTGNVRYTGDLAEFLPYLYAGHWTGVGRQTVWGNGQILVA